MEATVLMLKPVENVSKYIEKFINFLLTTSIRNFRSGEYRIYL